MKIKTHDKKSLEILLDEQDYMKAKNYLWKSKIEANRFRIYTYVDQKYTSLGRFLFDLESNELIIHTNGDKLDYRRSNIQRLTRKEYGHLYGGKHEEKSSKYHGIYFCKTSKKWYVRVNKDEKPMSEHSYFMEKEAAIVADMISIEKFGKKANLNFPKMSQKELKQHYETIKSKYGYTKTEIKSKSSQGISRAKNKASRYVGVTLDKRRKKCWVANIKYHGKKIWLGNFEKEVDAAKAYDKKAIELYGKWAKTNF